MKTYLVVGSPGGPATNSSPRQIAQGIKTYLVLGRPGSASAATSPQHLKAAMKSYLCTWPHGAGGDTRDIERGMKLYLADSQGRQGADLKAMNVDTITKERPLRILLSYHYYKDENLAELLTDCFGETPLDVFADSGAYSAWSIGESVDAEKYTAWVDKWKHLFTAAAGPDVIGDAVATTSATETMLAAKLGLTILPTFHVGEPWSYLDRWVGKVDYLAFGGMVPYSRQKALLEAWIVKAFSRLPPEMRVHGFGMTTWQFMLKYPWYSVDSSSWTSGFRFASLGLFDSRRGKFFTVAMNKPRSLLEHGKLLQSYGVRSAQIDARDYDRDLLCGLAVASWRRAEDWISKNKVNVYLACGSVPVPSGSGHVTSLANGLKTINAIEGDE